MSNLRKLLQTPVAVETKEVEYEGETYRLAGRPDSYVVDLQMLPINRRSSFAAMWRAQLAQDEVDATFEVSDDKEIMFDKVQQILLVHHYLLPPESENGEDVVPYQEYEIARISIEIGILFAQLFAAAMQLMKGANPEVDAVAGTALGNSQKPDVSEQA